MIDYSPWKDIRWVFKLSRGSLGIISHESPVRKHKSATRNEAVSQNNTAGITHLGRVERTVKGDFHHKQGLGEQRGAADVAGI